MLRENILEFPQSVDYNTKIYQGTPPAAWYLLKLSKVVCLSLYGTEQNTPTQMASAKVQALKVTK